MKLRVLVFMLIAVLAFGVPAFASKVEFGGGLDTKVELESKAGSSELDWSVYSKLNLGVDAGIDSISSGYARVNLEGINKLASEDGDTFSPFPLSLDVKEAYFGMNTALWPNGPSGDLKIGQQIVELPMLGAVTDHSGITYSNVAVDTLNAHVAYLWGNAGTAAAGEGTLGVHASRRGNDGTELAFSMLQKGEDRNMGFEGAANLLDSRLSVRAGRVTDADDNQSLYAKIGTELSKSWVLSYNYKDVADGFEWLHPVRDVNDEDEDGSTSDFVAVEHGKTHEVSLESRELQAVFSYKKVEEIAGETTTLTAKKFVSLANHPLIATYEQEREGSNVTHTLMGETFLPLGASSSVDLVVELVKNPSDDFVWDVEAGYQVPSGLSVAVGYASDAGARLGSAFTLTF